MRPPKFKPDHVLRLTDSTGMLQHALFAVPNYAHGYCTDDNARALLLILAWNAQGETSAALERAATNYTAFLTYALHPETKRFRNFMSYDRRWSNSYAYLFTGLAMLLAPLVAAGLVEMTGFLGFLGGLLEFVTFTVIWVVATAGFGAVILSRAGTRRGFVATPTDVAYESDPLFEDELSRGPRV